ncbi:MAG: nucleotide exchange factor GrpE [Chloroflexota bacterium]
MRDENGVERTTDTTPDEHVPAGAPEGEPTSAQLDVDGWQRARAELDNYRKRTERERGQLEAAILAKLIEGQLTVLDDFDRAMENLPEDIAEHEWTNGIKLIHQKSLAQLQELGLEEVETEGVEFDPNLHEAVTHEQSEAHESGTIIGVLRKGYKLDGRVIRPALVRVAS